MTSDPTDQTNAVYDAESRIKSINTGLATYTYNSLGNRVRKDLNGGPSTEYFYFNGQVMAELDPASSVFTNYVYFDSDRVARRDGTTGPVSYYFSDHLKTASVITDSTGNNIEAESDYYPWGGELQFVANDSNHYKFTGKERDSESGLDYFGARHYSNGLGRFITPDWSAKPATVPYAVLGDPQSLNLYTYVRNIPTTRSDADGHDVVLGNKTDKDRKATQSRITKNLTSQERKMFKDVKNQTTGKHELQLAKGAKLDGKHTAAFTRLAAEVNDHDHTATVKLQSSVTVNGVVQSVAVDYGGGATINQGNGNSLVLLAPEGNLNPSHPPGTTAGQNGGFVADPTPMIAGHETMGHAYEIMTTGHTDEGTVRHFENQMRQEQGLLPRSEH